jgi:hypothetical protein
MSLLNEHINLQNYTLDGPKLRITYSFLPDFPQKLYQRGALILRITQIFWGMCEICIICEIRIKA